MTRADDIRLRAGTAAEAQLASRAWSLGAAPATMWEELKAQAAVAALIITLDLRFADDPSAHNGVPLARAWGVDRVALGMVAYDQACLDHARMAAAGVPRDD